MIDRLADAGIPVDNSCTVPGVSRQGYYRYKRRALSKTALRRQWHTGLIREIHIASRGTYGYRRVHAELTMAMDVQVSKVYRAAVLDAIRRRIIGWSMDSRQDSTGHQRSRYGRLLPTPRTRGIVHADHGVQSTSWAFGEAIRSAGLMPSFGSVGDGLDNAMMESFWSSMRTELLNRKKWKTRLEFSNAIFDYIEIFCNRQRRHSSLGYRTPIEHELLSEKTPNPPTAHNLSALSGYSTSCC